MVLVLSDIMFDDWGGRIKKEKLLRVLKMSQKIMPVYVVVASPAEMRMRRLSSMDSLC